MEDDIKERDEEGKQLLAEHLGKAEGMAKIFLAALKGFRRDLALSVQSFPHDFDGEFSEGVSLLAVPPMHSSGSFSDLRKFLLLCDSALDGSISIKIPKAGPDRETRNKLLEEAQIAHKNLMEVADAASRLYQSIQNGGFEFDVFNTKNIEAGHPGVNILFDRDAVYVSAATARALGERAIRLDIDLVENIQRLQTGQKKIVI